MTMEPKPEQVRTKPETKATGNFDPATLRERFFSLEHDSRLLETAKKLAATLQQLPPDPDHPDWSPRALIVGGFARDVATGKSSKDIDLEVYGITQPRLEKLLMDMFPDQVSLKREFGWHKVDLGEGLAFDVTLPRRETKTKKGHTGFKVEVDPALALDQAAQRRDFTMNAIYVDPLTGEFVDPVGGLKDLEKKELRVVDPKTFPEDAQRVYRGVQFAARMGLKVEPKSLEIMRDMVADGVVDELSNESVRMELEKLFTRAEKPSVGLEIMRELGLVEKYFPELKALVGLPQEAEWHPEGDAWIHTLLVVDQAAALIRQKENADLTEQEKLELVLGSLCHDLGKPAVTTFSEGRIRAVGHEQAGAEPTKAFCERLVFPQEITQAAITIATQHIKPNAFYRALQKGELKEAAYANAVRKQIKAIQPMNWRVFILACEADWRGSALPGTDRGVDQTSKKFSETVIKNQLDKAPTKPLLQGRDILELAKNAGKQVQGKRIGEILKAVEALRDEGVIVSYEEAKEKAAEMI